MEITRPRGPRKEVVSVRACRALDVSGPKTAICLTAYEHKLTSCGVLLRSILMPTESMLVQLSGPICFYNED